MSRLVCVLGVCAVMLVTGCASPPMQTAQADDRSARVCDAAHMGVVERMAKENNASLIWVNCPLISRDRVKTS